MVNIAFTAEKAGWSGAPEVNAYLAAEKYICDEGLARIRAGTEENNYPYWFGKIDSIWRFVKAVGSRANAEKEIRQTEENRERLWKKIIAFGERLTTPQNLPILERQRINDLLSLKGEIISGFDDFYSDVLLLGVRAGLFSFMKGGNLQPPKGDRIAGVPMI